MRFVMSSPKVSAQTHRNRRSPPPLTPDTAPQFLALSNVRVCGGSWLTPNDVVQARNWPRITELAREATRLRV